MKKININTNLGSYKIYIGNKILNKVDFILKKNNIISNKFLIIIDSNIPKKYKKIFKSKYFKKKFIISIRFNEREKNYNSVEKILEILQKNNFNRNDSIICLGGGIAGDLCGFAASIFKRGLKFINIPTTLLSQVDSSIGGKTGFNTKFGKNLIGTFYQPNIVICDTTFLSTLPKRELISGYAEVIKHCLIRDKIMFDKIYNLEWTDIDWDFIINHSIKIKSDIVKKDIKENGLRKILNFGHTIGHAIETTYLNKLDKFLHGEAIAIGMICEAYISNNFNKLRNDELEKTTEEWCDKINSHAPATLRYMKTSLNFLGDLHYPSWMHGSELLNAVWNNEQSVEGMNAFKEKRNPDFTKFPR